MPALLTEYYLDKIDFVNYSIIFVKRLPHTELIYFWRCDPEKAIRFYISP